MKKKNIIGLLALIIVLVGCAPKNQNNMPPSEDKGKSTSKENVDIIAASYPVYDFATKITGDKLKVENMIPSGEEPHHWEPSPKDINKLESANLFVYNGADYQMWIDKVLDNVENKDLVPVDTTKDMDLLKAEDDHHEHEDHENEHDHEHGDYDPHTWTSPQRAKIQTEAIYNAIIAYDPENKDYYTENYNQFVKELDQLDNEYRKSLGNVKNKHIVISHESFGYLAHDYGLDQLGIRGYFDEQEPDPKTMKKIVQFIEETKVPVIFGETTGDKKVIETVANEANVKVAYLNPLETLSDEDIKGGKDYISVMRDNLKTLEEALNQ